MESFGKKKKIRPPISKKKEKPIEIHKEIKENFDYRRATNSICVIKEDLKSFRRLSGFQPEVKRRRSKDFLSNISKTLK